jgi:hypothetical protein
MPLLHSVAAMGWPPKIGEPLPRARDAWYQWSKVEDWVLGPRGHGAEWRTVFHVGLDDWLPIWEAIVEATTEGKIQVVRNPMFGITCGVDVELTINHRTAPVTLSWHYVGENSAPRLVTAYPNL